MSETFGQALRGYRRSAKISQRELADRIGIDFSYLSKLENDRISPPAADTVVAICHALGIDPEELLALTGKIPSDIQKTVSTSVGAQTFLREVQRMSLTDDEWQVLTKELRHLRAQR